MGTRSTIIQKIDSDTYRSIYCHWDGYLSNNGRILLKHYQDPEKVSKLLLLGSLSSLREEVDILEGKIHTYDNSQPNITIAYHRDRGEEWEHTSYIDKQTLKESVEEYYSYLYIDGDWYIPKMIVDEISEDEDSLFNMNTINNVIKIEDEEWVLLKDLEEFIQK